METNEGIGIEVMLANIRQKVEVLDEEAHKMREFGDTLRENVVLDCQRPEQTKFVLISDDDGHWYVCPADKQNEAFAYFEDPNAGYSDGPEFPEFLEPVGGATSRVKFTGYSID